jgi:hypothetical protein
MDQSVFCLPNSSTSLLNLLLLTPEKRKHLYTALAGIFLFLFKLTYMGLTAFVRVYVDTNIACCCWHCPPQEEDYSDDYIPGYILLKKEGGDLPTLVRRQPLRELPGRGRN